jgi:hypothetical protein
MTGKFGRSTERSWCFPDFGLGLEFDDGLGFAGLGVATCLPRMQSVSERAAASTAVLRKEREVSFTTQIEHQWHQIIPGRREPRCCVDKLGWLLLDTIVVAPPSRHARVLDWDSLCCDSRALALCFVTLSQRGILNPSSALPDSFFDPDFSPFLRERTPS